MGQSHQCDGPVFAKAIGVSPFTEEEVLRIAASIDQGSEYPLANAIVDAARGRNLPFEPFEDRTFLRFGPGNI
jgi:P-type Cu+ transporter